jgi:hypothetical protein
MVEEVLAPGAKLFGDDAVMHMSLGLLIDDTWLKGFRPLPAWEFARDGLDHLEHGEVRLPTILWATDHDEPMKRSGIHREHATVQHLRLHARLEQRDADTRHIGNALLAIADRLLAAGASPDDLLLDAARRLA